MTHQHAKQACLLVSVFWPAWQWVHRPAWRALFGSYAMDLSLRDSVRCRDLVLSDWYRRLAPHVELKSDQNLKGFYENTAKGFRLAIAVGGRATGFRGDAIVVDDPLNAKDAHSEAALNEHVYWFDRVLSTRLNDPRAGAKVVTMQRLHERDLADHLLDQGGWEHLCLPSEFET